MLIYYFVISAVLLLAAAAQRQDAVGNRFAAEPHAVPPGAYPHFPAARNTFIVMAAIPTLVAGLRYRVGSDYGAYYSRGLKYANEFWSSLLQLDEPGYRAIAYLTQRLGCQTGALAMFLASLITLGLGYWVVYRNSPQLFLPSVLFLFLGNYWIGSFNAVRQCLAATVVFCGYPFLRDKKLWHYAAMVFVAFLFHRSAILMIAPYFFVHREVTWRHVIWVLVGSIVVLNAYGLLFQVAEEVFDKEYLLTPDSYHFRSVNRLRVLSNVAPAAFFLWLHFGQQSKYAFSNLALNILTLNVVVSIVGMNSPLISRYSMYVHPFMAMTLPELCGKLPRSSRKPVAAGFILVYVVMTLYECSKSSALNHFHWIWEAM